MDSCRYISNDKCQHVDLAMAHYFFLDVIITIILQYKNMFDTIQILSFAELMHNWCFKVLTYLYGTYYKLSFYIALTIFPVKFTLMDLFFVTFKILQDATFSVRVIVKRKIDIFYAVLCSFWTRVSFQRFNLRM